MIASALITELRREVDDLPKSVRVSRQGNGSVNLFNVGKFPVIENSYSIYVSGAIKTEGSQFSYDLDNGNLTIVSTPGNGVSVVSQHQYAHWRDKHWVEAINQGIETLNARGYFRQVVRQPFVISAGVRTFNGPSACVDMYELLYSPRSGTVMQLPINWSYQQDANKSVLGGSFPTATSAVRSYLRNMQVYTAPSATLDILSDWKELVKKKAAANFYRSLAGKVAKQAHANIDEGHFSFTNLRAMANDLENEFNQLAIRKKPTRPAKDMQYYISNGGIA